MQVETHRHRVANCAHPGNFQFVAGTPDAPVPLPNFSPVLAMLGPDAFRQRPEALAADGLTAAIICFEGSSAARVDAGNTSAHDLKTPAGI